MFSYLCFSSMKIQKKIESAKCKQSELHAPAQPPAQHLTDPFQGLSSTLIPLQHWFE